MTRTCHPASATLGPVPISVGLQREKTLISQGSYAKQGGSLQLRGSLPKDDGKIASIHPVDRSMVLNAIKVLKTQSVTTVHKIEDRTCSQA